MKTALKKFPQYLFVLAFVATVVSALFISPRETYSQTTAPITGYAWSDGLGWISFNCSDLGTCGSSNYGLTIAVDGTISGYAWSEYAGWVSANSADLSGCPTAPCTARMNGNLMEGWMKALASSQVQSGGWDGFISLSGSSPSYGPTLSGGVFSGYAWGDMNLGWIDFSSAQHSARTTWVACPPSYACTGATTRDDLCTVPVENISCDTGLICSTGLCVLPPAPSTGSGGEIIVSPRLVRPGQTTLLSWNVSDATSCSVIGGGLNLSGISSQTSPCTQSGSSCVSNAVTSQTTFTLFCTGPGGNITQTATVYLNPAWKEI